VFFDRYYREEGFIEFPLLTKEATLEAKNPISIAADRVIINFSCNRLNIITTTTPKARRSTTVHDKIKQKIVR